MTSQPTYLADEGRSRELAARENEGLHVRLLWDPISDAVNVAVEDLHEGRRFCLAVPRERALDAFYHPFAYAVLRHRAARESEPTCRT